MMTIWMWGLLIFIVCQRLIELVIAKSNETWMLERGGVEEGEEHYKWFILLHVFFFLSIFLEIMFTESSNQQLNYYLLVIFLFSQIGRVWCIASLGRFWNTKIIILPGVSLISKGPYKYLKHPNYLIVAIELFIIPLLFKAYLTALLFPLLHILLLKIRVPSENKALAGE